MGLLFCNDSFSQPNIVDSLTNLEQTYKNKDTNRVNILNELSYKIYEKDKKLSKKYASEALEISTIIKYPKNL